jgi:hypothetical protein
MWINSLPWRCQIPFLERIACPPDCANARELSAICSVFGTTYSPSNTTNTPNINAGLNTDKTMRLIEIPAARITVSSLLLAKTPRPTKAPIRLAKGKNSYSWLGIRSIK